MVRLASLSCSQYSSAGSRGPDQTIARPELWMRSAICRPWETRHPRDVAGERLGHVREGVVIVVEDDHAPVAAQARTGLADARQLDDVAAAAHAASRSFRLRQ